MNGLRTFEKIKEILPHRDPFLFIDQIQEIGNDYIIGVKFVKEDEDYFQGHFPNEPIMPGVLQLETMAQTGGVLILNTVKNPQDYLTFFMKIDNAKFKKKVVLSCIVDKTLIGGATIIIGDYVIDGSIKRSLELLKNSILVN